MTAGRQINTKSQAWGTPQKYADAVREVFDGEILLDPCAGEYSVVGADVEYRLPEKDGLKDSWDFAKIYVNPPYGICKASNTSIRHWLRRCADAHQARGAEVMALVPVATNTRHWKEHVFTQAAAICFLYDTRLKFLENGHNGGKGAPMACAMIYWGRRYQKFYQVFIHHGAVVDIRPLLGERIEEARNQAALFKD